MLSCGLNRRFSALRFALRVALLMASACLALSGPATAQNTDPDPAQVDNDSNGLIEIYTLEALNNIRHDLNGASYKTSPTDTGITLGCPMDECNGYELMANLDFDTNGNGRTDMEGDDYWNGGAGWEPIGTDGARFTARLEGNGHTIANLFINRPATDDVGLFGYADGARIGNLGLVDADVTGNNAVGGLVGIILGGNIMASYVSATVSGSGDVNVGGLVGYFDGDMTESYAEATVSGSNNVGGLVGRSQSGADIAASSALSTVSGDSHLGGLIGWSSGDIVWSYAVATVSGGGNAGGLVGWNNALGSIAASYAVATVSGDDNVGGLAGENSGTISASYAVTTVLGNDNIGGLAGQNSGAAITASYALATVSGNTDIGGLAGSNNVGTVTASYFNIDFATPSDQTSGRTTSELQTPTTYTDTIYADWNVDIDGDGAMDNPWRFGTATQYPGLVFPLVAGSCPATSEGITVVMAGEQCIHRPLTSSANAGPSALRLRLRVFLESALP